MNYKSIKYFFLLIFLFFLVVFAKPVCASVVDITNLKVEYTDHPLGIDVKDPRFSWQMVAPEGERGYLQSAYQIVVKNPTDDVVWDSGKIESGISLNIEYAGSPVKAATRYNWTVKVWDQKGEVASASSWFETGLMNPDPKLSAWDGATWIGGDDDDLVLYAPYLSVFKLGYSVKLDEESNSTKAGFIFGANDSRLMDKNKNIYGVESKKNESYIKLELDISPVDGSKTGLAQLNIYRVGYHPDDKQNVPFKKYSIPLSIINSSNKYKSHNFYIEVVFGLCDIYIDAKDRDHLLTKTDHPDLSPFSQSKFNLNPVGYGNNFISFPMLGEIGFAVDANQKALFSNVEVRNYRSPSTKLFYEELSNENNNKGIFSNDINDTRNKLKIDKNGYWVEGGENGCKIVADPGKNSMPMLRTTFHTENKKITKARLYITARGIYEAYINGERVGNDYFNPGLTQYNKTHMYQTYDVTNRIEPGRNAVGALLGEGWWSGNISYSGENWNYFGDRQSLLAKLVIIYADGSKQIVTSNPDDWKYYNKGPVVYGSFFQGEVYDASKEQAISGWTTANYDDSTWGKAVKVPMNGTVYLDQSPDSRMGVAPVTDYNEMALIGQFGENVSIVKELTAIGMEEVRPGVFVYDMSQNMVGVPRITAVKGTKGQEITLRYAEVKYPDLPEYGDNVGMIMLENIRAALAQDIYMLKGDSDVIQPRFTFHGYRFLEITGIKEPLPLESVKGLVISSVNELALFYETSNPKINKLWENITWSTRGNFLSIPTDCPQRNERMGWSGDLSVFARTSSYLANVPQFLRRHMLGMRDVQRNDGRFTDVAPLGGGFGGILWGSAGITVAWESYQQYGDKAMLAEHYDAMKKYLSFLNTRIDPKTGVMNEGPLGDWLSPEGNRNDNTLIWEAYYVFDLEIMVKIADTLGKPKDAAGFRTKNEERKAFFNKTYIDAKTKKTIRSGFVEQRMFPPGMDSVDKNSVIAGVEVDTQASYAVPLALGVIDSVNEEGVAQNLAKAVMRKNTDDSGIIRSECSLMTGFIGTAWVSKALSDHGYNDIAYHLLQQTTYPSWLYSVDQGATTIWERLNSYTVENGFGGNNSMNSFNHYSFGAVGAWMYNYSLGIQRDENYPGFKHFILQPEPDPTGKMAYAKGYYDSMYGRISSSWEKDGEKLVYSATIPANTTATLYLPSADIKNIEEGEQSAMESEGVKFIKCEKGKAVFELQSGKYQFEID